jgi:23S rRNA pseudouridine2605 synthase
MIERLQKIISGAGLMSRRAADELISRGKVRVNGTVAVPGTKADPEVDSIEISGVRINSEKPGKSVYILLNKPRGYVTTLSDEKGRKTVLDLVQLKGIRVFPVGRLDMDTEGLLLLTNDGETANKLMHPSHSVRKTYLATIRGDAEGNLKKLCSPLVIDGRPIRPAKASIIRKTGENEYVIQIEIGEGRNRQVRKMCELCNLEVLRLIRIGYGALELAPGSMKLGTWRHLTGPEVEYLKGIE